MEVKEYSFRGVAYKLSALERISQDPSWFTHEDESEVRDRDWTVGPGDVVLDVGSAYGSYALTALVSGASLVRCWNYNAEENCILKESLSLNGWDDKCDIRQVGLWSSPGYLEDVNNTFSTEEGGGRFRVTTLDLELPEPGKIDWIKLDVEGAEVEVLRGAESILRIVKPRVQVENHQFKDPSIEGRVRVLLESFGYEHVRTVPYHGVSHSSFVAA